MTNEKLVPCPVCNSLVFLAKDYPGSYVICKFCGWEDDFIQVSNPTMAGGANDVSLDQAKENYIKYGTSDPSRHSRE
jgi:hypothetical protein